MKKWITAILCLALLCVLAIPTLAADEVKFTVLADKTQVMPGETVTFTVVVTGGAACTSYSLVPTYDSRLEYVSGSCTVTGASMSDFDGTSFIVAYSSPTVPSGTVGTFTLKVKSDAKAGQIAVTVAQTVKNIDEDVPSTSGSVNISVGCNHQYDNDCDDTCNLCTEKRTAPHAWDAGSVTTKPGCTSVGTKTYTCTACKITKTEDIKATGHKYDNDCDTACNTCDDTREAKHDYAWQSTAEEHWQQCKVCGHKKAAAKHTPGAEPTETKGQDCTACGRQLKAPLAHTHTYSDQWKFDVMGHWHPCTGCGDMKDSEPHAYDNECDEDCNVCGAKRNPQHIYEERYSSNADGHWHQCINCGDQMEFEPHISGPEATLESAQLCTVCGYELAPSLAHKHDYTGDWESDADGHWHICGSCGMAEDKAQHNWDAGRITRQPSASVVGRKTFTCTDCGYERIEDIPVEPVDDVQKPGFPWWLIIVIVAVPVVAVSTYLIVNAGKGKEDDEFTDEE